MFAAPQPAAGAPCGDCGDSAGGWPDGSTLRQVLESFRQLARDTTSGLFGAAGGGHHSDGWPQAAARPEMAASRCLGVGAGSTHGRSAVAASCPALDTSSKDRGPEATRPPPIAGIHGAVAGERHEERRGSGDEAATSVGVFELIGPSGSWRPSLPGAPRPPPLSEEEWSALLDARGRLTDESRFRQRCFYGGVEPGLRRTVWKYLLGVFPMASTAAERDEILVRCVRARAYGERVVCACPVRVCVCVC